jgi:hypothetical protein
VCSQIVSDISYNNDYPEDISKNITVDVSDVNAEQEFTSSEFELVSNNQNPNLGSKIYNYLYLH